MPSDLDTLRKEINALDAQMASLFERRMKVCADVAQFKKENGIPVKDSKRESEVIERNSALVKEPALKEYYRSFISSLMALSRRYQSAILADDTADAGAFKAERILIVGLGLMGGSYAKALSAKGFEIGAIDIDKDSIDYALSMGWIKRGSTEVNSESLKGYDLVIMCLYPREMIHWLEQYSHLIPEGTLLTDITGIKCPVVYKAQEILGRRNEFIASHPMAGTEKSGVRNSDCSVFNGANFLVVPTECNTTKAIDSIKGLGKVLGFGRVSTLSPEQHDDMVGFLSHLTHCIAISLMTCRDDVEALSPYSGDSFRDLTRIANINGNMWAEIFSLNSEELVRQIDTFCSQLQRFKAMIKEGDSEGMKEMMEKSTARRKLFDK